MKLLLPNETLLCQALIISPYPRDIVKCIDGPHSGRQGEIKHLFRNYAFLHSRMMLDNRGEKKSGQLFSLFCPPS